MFTKTQTIALTPCLKVREATLAVYFSPPVVSVVADGVLVYEAKANDANIKYASLLQDALLE